MKMTFDKFHSVWRLQKWKRREKMEVSLITVNGIKERAREREKRKRKRKRHRYIQRKRESGEGSQGEGSSRGRSFHHRSN